MAQATYAHDGNAVDYTPGSAVTAGDVVFQNDLAGVAPSDIAASVLGSLQVTGVHRVTKTGGGGITFAVGDKVYWDDANNLAVRTPGVGRLLGVCVYAAADADTYVLTYVHPSLNGAEGLVYSAEAASTAVTNTTTETKFDKSVTLPANTLKVGDVIKVRAQVIATSTNSTDTLDIQLRLNTTDVIATGAVDVANNDIAIIDFELVIRTVGASGTYVGAGYVSLGAAGTVTAKAQFKASTAIDTTAAQEVNVSATWSVASASNSCRLDILNVEIKRK